MIKKTIKTTRTKYNEYFIIFKIILNKINSNQKNNDKMWMKNKLKNYFKSLRVWCENQREEKEKKKKILSMMNRRYTSHTRHPRIEGSEANVWGLDYVSWSI